MRENVRTFVVILALGVIAGGCSEKSGRAAEGPAAQPSSPAAAPQPAPPQSAAPQPTAQAGGYEGFIDEVSCDVVRGWAWDPSRPDAPLTIELYDGTRLLKTLVADQLRPDLRDGGKGNGKHMFREAAPKEFKDGRPHEVRAVIKGSGYALKPSEGASASVTCPSGT